jgi:hypothetical protein
MTYENFYVLEPAIRKGCIECAPATTIQDGYALMKGTSDTPDAIEFRWRKGRDKCDFLITDWMIILISESLRRLFVNRRYSGWKSFEAPILKDGEVLCKYHGLVVTGKSGPIDNSLSKRVVYPSPVPEGNEHEGLQGLYFPINSWDGSDIFSPQGTMFVMATQRVRDSIEEYGATGVELTAISDVENIVAEY